MTHAQCLHERSLRRADRLAGAASVDADVNVGSKKGCICELQLCTADHDAIQFVMEKWYRMQRA